MNSVSVPISGSGSGKRFAATLADRRGNHLSSAPDEVEAELLGYLEPADQLVGEAALGGQGQFESTVALFQPRRLIGTRRPTGEPAAIGVGGRVPVAGVELSREVGRGPAISAAQVRELTHLERKAGV